MSKDELPTDEELEAMVLATFGVSLKDLAEIPIETMVELAMARGAAFACTENAAPIGEDGKPVYASDGGKRTKH